MADDDQKTPGQRLYERWRNTPGSDREAYLGGVHQARWEALAVGLGLYPHPNDDEHAVAYRVELMAGQPWPEVPAGLVFATDADRNWSKFDLSECGHKLSTLVERAGWSLDICVACGTVTRGPVCEHPAGFEWNEAGTLLRCKTCGVDGT